MIKKIPILLSLVLLAVPIMATACNDNSTDNSTVTLTVTPVPQVEGAAFTGNYSFYGIDSDGDGIYNSLAIDAEVNISIAGDYYVTGSLESSDTLITDSRFYYSTIPNVHCALSVSEPGLETITLTLSGEDIYRSGIDGIYTADLFIGRNGSVVDYQSFDSPFYNHNEFGELPAGMEVIADYGEDIDGNGLFDYLTAEVDVTVRGATDYILVGILYCKEGEITSVTNAYYLEESVVLKLNFDGTKLRLSEIDGPYLLDVNLYCEYYNQIGSQEYFTSTYMHTDFQEPAHRFTGTYSDYGTDTDGDGLYNYLTIEVGIEITASGDYTVIGQLYDSSGEERETAETSAHLEVGVQSLTINFSGSSINRNRIDGPYYLKYLLLHGSEMTDIFDFEADAYATSAYKSTDFSDPYNPYMPWYKGEIEEEELEAAETELANVQAATIAMMIDNKLTELPNPVTEPTNDMSAFPDNTSACGVDKINDWDGNAYQSGDKDGYILYQHDTTADNMQSNLVNYINMQYTSGTYTVDADGTVTQVTPGFE